MDKPQKPENLLPSSFGGIKRNFSDDLQQVGYEPDVKEILSGANLNYWLDSTGRNFEYNNKIVDFVNGLPIDNIITTDENNKLVYINRADLGGANTDLSNLTSEGEKHFLNKTQVTNCILEAPNGVASYSSSTVTVKQGLKVLFSNGFNEDGSLKNIEYTIEEDLARTYTNTIENGYLFLYLNNGVIEQTWQSSNYYLIGNNNTNISSFTGIFRNNDTNITDYYTNGVASDTRYICIGNNINSTNGVISSLTPFNPIDLLKKSDKSEISGWGFPSGTQIPLSLLASGEAYVAPLNGYFYISKVAGITNAYVSMYSNGIGSSVSSGSAAGNCVITMKCQKGNQCTIIYNATGATNTFVFVPTKGEY